MNPPAHQHAASAPHDLSEVIARFDGAIEAFLASRQFPENLHEAMRYSTLGGGKRLRPALAWYSSIACGGAGEDAVDAGVAVELIHAFSLVHDDLPALDDDDMRRGRPTLHRHASEAMAILAGDALLSLAYEAVLAHAQRDIGARLVEELARGTRAMIVGQVYDTLGGLPGGLDDEQRLKLVHCNKTGALLTAACRMGAICAGASERALGLITRYAQAIGLQFQIVDDLLDVEGSSDDVGKAVGKDAALGKLTYPGALGIERSRAIVDSLAGEARGALDELGALELDSTEALARLGAMLTSRTR